MGRKVPYPGMKRNREWGCETRLCLILHCIVVLPKCCSASWIPSPRVDHQVVTWKVWVSGCNLGWQTLLPFSRSGELVLWLTISQHQLIHGKTPGHWFSGELHTWYVCHRHIIRIAPICKPDELKLTETSRLHSLESGTFNISCSTSGISKAKPLWANSETEWEISREN